jgi:hypothetical protein
MKLTLVQKRVWTILLNQNSVADKSAVADGDATVRQTLSRNNITN